MSVADLLSRADSHELSQWYALYRLEAREAKERDRRQQMNQGAMQGVDNVKKQLKGHRR
jgi:cytochrome c553